MPNWKARKLICAVVGHAKSEPFHSGVGLRIMCTRCCTRWKQVDGQWLDIMTLPEQEAVYP